jgi:hypothetical protein
MKSIAIGLLLALPTLLAAQTPTIPNDHASDQGKAMVALHSQGAAHRATHRRGEVVPVAPTDNPNAATPATRATRATPATPAVPGNGGPATPAVPAKPATPATPAVPAHKGGQSGSHRP